MTDCVAANWRELKSLQTSWCPRLMPRPSVPQRSGCHCPKAAGAAAAAALPCSSLRLSAYTPAALCPAAKSAATPPVRRSANPPSGHVQAGGKDGVALDDGGNHLAQTIKFPLIAPSSSRHIQAGGEDNVAFDGSGGGGHLRPQRGVSHDTRGVAKFAACLIQPHHRAHY